MSQKLAEDLQQKLGGIIKELREEEERGAVIVATAEAKAKSLMESTQKSIKKKISQQDAKLLEMQEEVDKWNKEKLAVASTQTIAPRIKIDVGGTRHVTSSATLTRFPNTMLGAMFSGRHELTLDEDGYFFIDRDGTHFRHILNFLRNPECLSFELSPPALRELKREAEYYGLADEMFPFTPAEDRSVNAEFFQPGYGNTTCDVTVSQTKEGIWQISYSKNPNQGGGYYQQQQKSGRITSNAIVCKSCGFAFTPKQSDNNSYYAIKNFLQSNDIFDLQPEPAAGQCLKCSGAFTSYDY
jgi:hypothetical protein